MAMSFPTRSYMPLQCPLCKGLLLNPLTLPCGFTVCQSCLPPTQTIDFQQQIRCPFQACARSNLHLPDQFSIDVTLQNLTTALRTAGLQSGNLVNLLSEDAENAKPHRQPDTLFYGNTSADPAWDATLEGLYDPYETIPTSSSSSPSSTAVSSSVFYRNVPFIIDSIRAKIQQDVECQVCFLVFEQPITTSCGHTLCKSCLITSLDHKPNCPLCRRQLPLYMYYHNQPPNKALLRFIQYLASRPDTSGIGIGDNDIPQEEREIESTLSMTPLFINSLIFPRMPCYLLVFEPRYRKLLRSVLKTESKVFGMVLPPRPRKHRDLEMTAWEPSMEYGTLLKVLSCELLQDGRALVETVGLSRFQILTYTLMSEGFYAASAIELIHDIPLEQELGLEKAALEAAAAQELSNDHADRSGGSDGEGSAHNDEEITTSRAAGFSESSGKRDQDVGDASTSLSGSSDVVQLQGESIPATEVTASSPSAFPVLSSMASSGSRTLEAEDLGLHDLHKQELETLSRAQLMQILVAFVTHMQERLGPLATQRLQREFGEMVEDDGQAFSFWVASILPVRNYQKYELLKVRSVRQRLLTVLGWVKDIEARRSMAVCSIS
ncbi:hypothetical protein BGZ99_005773 [Dissophora globulifera]|uniref:Uncharacterized protein n=1 Tax=Dissophora globulifera TaxID=979702 RepID=A0A9P6RWJ9_9FUNG|nr:hypothetical protein BGZ99_005773 [Dissophora globulifera]